MVGRTLAHYQILEKLDPKLGRDVAIKVLPQEFARNPERVARFEREARVLASLNHSNIAAIYGFEEALAQARVLDFGLAKALDDDERERDGANSPTLSLAATRAGMILGTAGYMSPEQAKGKRVDRRAWRDCPRARRRRRLRDIGEARLIRRPPTSPPPPFQSRDRSGRRFSVYWTPVVHCSHPRV